MALLLGKIQKVWLFSRMRKSRKLRASTLIEVLVASVLIITVFTIASLTLNNMFKSNIKSNTRVVETRMNELSYMYSHKKIDTKYQEDFNEWRIYFSRQENNNLSLITLEAVQIGTNKTISKKLINESFE